MAFGPWLGEWAVGRWGFDGGFMVGGLCMGLAAIIACWLPDFVGSRACSGSDYKAAGQSSLLYRTAIWPGIVMALGIESFHFAWLYAEGNGRTCIRRSGAYLRVVWVACVGVTSPV